MGLFDFLKKKQAPVAEPVNETPATPVVTDENPKFATLTTKDIIKGGITALITTIATGIYQLVNAGGVLDAGTAKPIVISGIGAFIAYLIKNFFTNSKDQFGVAEPKKEEANA